MKIDKLNCCVKSILSIYNGSPPVLFFGMSYIIQLGKHDEYQLLNKHEMRNVETITHTQVSL